MAVERDPLHTAINMPLSLEGKATIISSFWNTMIRPGDFSTDLSEFATYFRYYEEQCKNFLYTCTRSRHWVFTKTHRDVVKLGQLLQGAIPGPTLRKPDILEAFRATIPASAPPATEQLLSDTIDFVARLMLMIDIEPVHSGRRVLNQIPIPWDGCCLPELLSAQFTGQKELEVPVRLEHMFIAPNLESLGDIKVVWTDNLADHLKMSDDDTQVDVFSHIQFLRMNRNK
jgi:hypothetical protein